MVVLANPVVRHLAAFRGDRKPVHDIQRVHLQEVRLRAFAASDGETVHVLLQIRQSVVALDN